MISDYAEQRQPIDFSTLNPEIFGLEINEAFLGSFEMTCSSRQGHDMRKGHTLFCILKYTQKQDNSGSGGLRELIQSYRMCYYKSHQETASKSGDLSKSTTHHGNLRQLRQQNMQQDMTRWRQKRTMKRSDLSTFADVEVNYHN